MSNKEYIMDNINNLSLWAEHLKDPLTLVGFVVMLIVGLIAVLFKNKKKSSRLLERALLYVFIIGLLVVLSGLWLSYNNSNKVSKHTPETSLPENKVHMITSGEQSPAVKSSGNVNINYGNEREQTRNHETTSQKQVEEKKATISTSGNQSPAIDASGGEVTINYGKEKE